VNGYQNNGRKMKSNVFLCGFQRIGVLVLHHLLQRDDVDRIAVFTHEAPDHITDLRTAAHKCGVWCTTASVNAAQVPFEPDIIASVYYRHVIMPNILQRSGGKAFNVHPSLLPRHRGCSSLTWSLFEGDTVTGITFHYMDNGIDTGNIILQAAIQISADDTQATLFERAMDLGAAYWPAAFELVKTGFSGMPQQGEATYHGRGVPYGGAIDESWDLPRIERFIRAMTNPPYPYAKFRELEVRTIQDFIQAKQQK
jgi:methionyl-tRNA formyltransferase